MPGGSITSGANTFDFITLRGTPQSQGMIVEELPRPGVDGQAYRELGRRAEPFEMIGVRDVESDAAARHWIVALRQLQGTLVTVTDDFAITTPNVMLLLAAPLERKPLLAAAGGLTTGATRLVILRFLMQLTQPPA
jgi:hypothetical protein